MNNKVCAFSTSNDSYALTAAVSLLSIRSKNSRIDLYIIGKKFSDATKKILDTYNVRTIEVDLSDRFYKSWDYPEECYYVFAGPDIFYARGYKQSLYIDGDIYCNNNPFQGLPYIESVAGVTNGTCKDILRNDIDTIDKHWRLPQKSPDRIQSGVLYFNNEQLSKIGFFDEISEIYDKSIKLGIPRKGDDSLFALYQYIKTDLKPVILGKEYNCIQPIKLPTKDYSWLTNNHKMINKTVFYHFTSASPKPWNTTKHYPDYTTKHFTHKWRQHAASSLKTEDFVKYFPAISSLIKTPKSTYFKEVVHFFLRRLSRSRT